MANLTLENTSWNAVERYFCLVACDNGPNVFAQGCSKRTRDFG